MALLSRAFVQGMPLILRQNALKNSWIQPSSIYPGLVMFNRQKQSKVKISVVRPNPLMKELSRLDYEERNKRRRRVLSPHLTIYKPQLTSMLSITQRITGIALTVYVWGLGIGALLTSHDIQHFITIFEGLEHNSTCLAFVKFILSVPFTFHYLNSFRHLLWSFGKMLKLNLVYTTGYMVLALTPLSAIALAFL